MEQLSSFAKETYRSLIDHPGFISFYTRATPIDVLERSKIGSRPSRRSGTRTLNDLRAIPWVFSWNQSRFDLTGWFGVGSSLERLHQKHPQQWEELRKAAHEWPLLQYTLIEVETSLLNSDAEVTAAFANMVPDETTRNSIMQLLEQDRRAGLDQIAELFGEPSQERRQGLLANIERNWTRITMSN